MEAGLSGLDISLEESPVFVPPHCPNPNCSARSEPRSRRFYVRNGSYKPKCRRTRVPRFKCRQCGTGFSRQTFRDDYHDHKPALNAQLLRLLGEGASLRSCSATLRLSRRCTQLKARKLLAVAG